MKTLNLLTTSAFAAMMLFSSCSKDDNETFGAGNGQEVVPGLATYATLSLSQKGGGAGTYANGDYTDPESGATADETKIGSAIVFVFNQFDVLENLIEFEAADIAAKQKIFATTTGKKRLYALANLPKQSVNNFKAIFNGTTADKKKLSNICKEIQQITSIESATTANQFFMSNVYKINANIEDQITVLNKSKEEVEQGTNATANNFTIFIGRMTGKVSLTFANPLDIKSGDGNFIKDGTTYRVRNNPKRFYTFPVYEDAQLVSPYYALDYLADGTGKYPAALGKADFFDNGNDVLGNQHDFVAHDEDSYLTENSPKEAKRHKVTFLSIKSKWEPNQNALFLDADAVKVGDPVTEGVDVITDNQGTFYRVQKWQNGSIIGYCPGIYVEMPQKAHKGDDYKDNAQDNTDLVLAQDFVQRADAKKDQSGDVKYVIATYEQGIAYYAYWMKSRNDGTIAEKYTLKRNNHYKVNIISVDGVGEPVEDDNLDKDENIEADTHMKATIEVLNWNEVSIEGGI